MVWNLGVLVDVKGLRSGFIFLHGYKLYAYQDDEYGKRDFFDHD